MGSHLIDTPPPTPPDSEYPDPTWGGGLRGPKATPPIPQLPVLKRRSSAPDTLLAQETLGRLEISSRGYTRSSDYNQFTPDDSPISDQLGATPTLQSPYVSRPDADQYCYIAHEIPATTNLETNFSKRRTFLLFLISVPPSADRPFP
jgi:hypothetical protein